MRTVLQHLITTDAWRSVLAAGAIDPLPEFGFVHLSTPEQVALPANRLFAGRTDVLLLVLDPTRIGVEVRWEPGVPGDPESMRFPHAYGPVPASAVLAVEPYRPDGAGVFAAPGSAPADVADRCLLIEPSITRRMAGTELPVTGGVAVRTPAVSGSRQHNQLLIDGPTDAATLLAEADTALDGLPHRMATLLGEAHRPTAVALAGAGWEVDEIVVMAGPPAGARSDRVEAVDVEALRPTWGAMWRRQISGITDATVADLADRYLLQQSVVDNRYLAVRDGDQIVAAALLSIDGATAWLNDVFTEPEHRGRRHGDALVAEAMALAAEAGCDVVGLGAVADDWPRSWYARRGFAEVNRCWCATRT
jgi:uncharacterized protein (DUF952 family)/GNAT superfamily N-acetyltransferase